MPISIDRKLHKKKRKAAVGKAGRCLAFLMCGLICLFSWKWDIHAEGYYTPVDATIPFVCYTVEGAESDFQIQIKSESVGAPLPIEDTIHIDQEGQGTFKIKLTEPGTFDYLVYEIEGTDDTVHYDNTRYDVHVYVTSDEEDRLDYMVAVNYENTDEKPAKVEFKNDIKGQRRPTEETTEEITEEMTTEGTTEKPPTNVKTGDDTSLTLLITLCTVSASGILAILGLVMMRRSKDRKELDMDPNPEENSGDTDKSDE
ncbi:MAG: hypothetical protein IJM25_00485 [Eubacterium sp.]|nr:hypothetical protein [Eubacterium sp.]